MEMVDLNLNQAPLPPDGPGSTSDRVVDIGSNDPLVNLGLVDARTGAALATDEWTPEAQSPAPTVPQTAPAQTTAPASDSAPAPTQVLAPQGPTPEQNFQVQAATLQAQAAQAYAEAVAGGLDPQVAERVIGADLRAALTEARTASIQARMYPVVKQQAASLIAQTHGAGQVRPEELIAYESPQAMEQAAQQLAAARRATNFQQRQSTGTDRTEGTAPARGVAPAIAGLSPEKKIELGIRRGQYS